MIIPRKPIHYERYEFNKWEAHDADTIVEMPVSLTVNGEVWLTFMCTPVHLEAMAVGFLYNEGIIEKMGQVVDVRVCDQNGIERTGIEGRVLPVTFAQFLQALEQTAVDEHSRLAGFNQIFRSGDGPYATPK